MSITKAIFSDNNCLTITDAQILPPQNYSFEYCPHNFNTIVNFETINVNKKTRVTSVESVETRIQILKQLKRALRQDSFFTPVYKWVDCTDDSLHKIQTILPQYSMHYLLLLNSCLNACINLNAIHYAKLESLLHDQMIKFSGYLDTKQPFSVNSLSQSPQNISFICKSCRSHAIDQSVHIVLNNQPFDEIGIDYSNLKLKHLDQFSKHNNHLFQNLHTFMCMSNVAKTHLVEIMQGNVRSFRHSLFQSRKEREQRTGEGLSTLWFLANVPFISNSPHEENITSFLNQLVVKHNELHKIPINLSLDYVSTVLIPEICIFYHHVHFGKSRQQSEDAFMENVEDPEEKSALQNEVNEYVSAKINLNDQDSSSGDRWCDTSDTEPENDLCVDRGQQHLTDSVVGVPADEASILIGDVQQHEVNAVGVQDEGVQHDFPDLLGPGQDSPVAEADERGSLVIPHAHEKLPVAKVGAVDVQDEGVQHHLPDLLGPGLDSPVSEAEENGCLVLPHVHDKLPVAKGGPFNEAQRPDICLPDEDDSMSCGNLVIDESEHDDLRRHDLPFGGSLLVRFIKDTAAHHDEHRSEPDLTGQCNEMMVHGQDSPLSEHEYDKKMTQPPNA